jgi:glutamate--cysteine ligase
VPIPNSSPAEALGDPEVRGALAGLRRGIEKESLRVTPEGRLSQRPHPAALGSALTHPHITTDFSEAQLELITDVCTTVEDCLAQLEETHAWVYRGIGDELLWGASMPCVLQGEERIPVGRYGRSNVGMAKTVYRRGLALRYGALMQTISGIHYNFSVPPAFWDGLARREGRRGDRQELATERYFGLIRNFRRYSWLLFYLFGASPAVCKSFLAGREHGLVPFDEGSLHLPFATSLRMGGIGYQSDAQASLKVSYNGLESYARTLEGALTRPWPAYEALGLEQDGEFRQLSTSLLQIENEFYGTIRPKRSIRPGERPLHALGERGVEYVEVRCLDLDPFLPLGIDATTVRFLDAFLLHCLLEESPPDTPEEIEALQHNRTLVVEEGRRPELELHDGTGGTRPLRAWARELLAACEETAAAIDAAVGGRGSREAVAEQRRRVEDAGRTPSARVLATMRERGVPFFRFAMDLSEAHAKRLRAHPLAPETVERLRAESEASVAEQTRMEAADETDFASYRRAYIEQPLLPERAAGA